MKTNRITVSKTNENKRLALVSNQGTSDMLTSRNSIHSVNNVNYTNYTIDSSDYFELEHTKKAMSYNYLFKAKNLYVTKEEFISNEYINITKGLIKSLALKSNVAFCYDIIKKNYKDNIFDDLCNEVAIILLENKDFITQENCSFKIDNETMIKCCRTINKYGYNNKTKQDKTQVALTKWNDKNEEFDTIAVKTQAFKNYCLESYNDLSISSTIQFLDIIENVKLYVLTTEKTFIYEKCCCVLDGLMDGLKNKEIATKYNISVDSVTKYSKILKNAFYVLYKKPYAYEQDIKEYKEKRQNDGKTICRINQDTTHKALKPHEKHDLLQKYYSSIFANKTHETMEINLKNSAKPETAILLENIENRAHLDNYNMYLSLFEKPINTHHKIDNTTNIDALLYDMICDYVDQLNNNNLEWDVDTITNHIDRLVKRFIK